MIIVDANIILRYLLNDDTALFSKSIDIIEKKEIFIPHEIVAETVYVLEKVYKTPRHDIKEAWNRLIAYPNLKFLNKQVLLCAFNEYTKIQIDFVDSY